MSERRWFGLAVGAVLGLGRLFQVDAGEPDWRIVAVDKIGGHVLFIDPDRRTITDSIDAPPRPHVVSVSPDGRRAAVPIYGRGIFGSGDEADHRVMVFDLARRRLQRIVDVGPLRRNHQAVWVDDRSLLVTAEADAAIGLVDAGVGGEEAGGLVERMPAGSRGCHRMAVTSDRKTIFVEGENVVDFVTVVDVESRKVVDRIELGTPTAGIALSPDDATVVVVDGDEPALIEIDAESREVTRTIPLQGHTEAAQIAEYSPDGRFIVVTSFEEPLVTRIDREDPMKQVTLRVGEGLMGFAFHPDAPTLWIADHDGGEIIVVDVESWREVDRFPAGAGVETLAFYDDAAIEYRPPPMDLVRLWHRGERRWAESRDGRLRLIAGVNDDNVYRVDWQAVAPEGDWFERPNRLLPPVAPGGKIIAVGKNYRAHAEEQGADVPDTPILFAKYGNTPIGDGDVVELPPMSEAVDYEVELALVIGRGGKNIPKESALSHVMGYTVANDVTARDWQKGKPGGQWMIGKSIDTFAPMGPRLVSAATIDDPSRLHLTLKLNADVMQDADASLMIFDVPTLIAHVSRFITLEPGDVILTGTPAGVGFARKPPVYLKAGDRMEATIEGIGTLVSPVR